MARRAITASALALAVGCVVAGCGSRPPPAEPVGHRGGGGVACVAGLIGESGAEAVAVAAGPEGVYWLDYNFGQLRRQGRDGRVTALVPSGEEQNSEELIVAGGHLYWDSKAKRTIHRMSVAGGAPETIIRVPGDDFPFGLAVAGDVVYTRTFEGELMWWRAGRVGQRKLEITSMASRGASLYLGGSSGIGQLDEPDGEVWDVTMDTFPVASLAVVDDTLFWIERLDDGALLRRRALAGGAIQEVAGADGAAALEEPPLSGVVAGPGGVYLGVGDVVLFVPARGPAVAHPVARAPEEIIDLAVDGDALIAGTGESRVLRLCPGPPR